MNKDVEYANNIIDFLKEKGKLNNINVEIFKEILLEGSYIGINELEDLSQEIEHRKIINSEIEDVDKFLKKYALGVSQLITQMEYGDLYYFKNRDELFDWLVETSQGKYFVKYFVNGYIEDLIIDNYLEVTDYIITDNNYIVITN